MSVAEKLKARMGPAVDALEELAGDANWAHAYQPGGDEAPDREPDVSAILDALPQIVAVVEAAEHVVILTYNPVSTDEENDEYQRRAKAFNAALAALDEALTTKGER